MNLRFEISPERPDSIPEVTARMQAAKREIRDQIRGVVAEAVREGQRIAEAEAPYGPDRRFREGVRIRDAIRTSDVSYSPGGSGGGGFYEADLYASSALSPEVQYVMEGTKDDGRGLIRPSRGNVLALQKEGEGVHFRAWVHGQAPQTLWWDHAREGIEQALETGTDNIQ